MLQIVVSLMIVIDDKLRLRLKLCYTYSTGFTYDCHLQLSYKKILVSRTTLSLLLKIYFQNTLSLQLNNINQIKSKWNYSQKIIKGPAGSWLAQTLHVWTDLIWNVFFILNIVSNSHYNLIVQATESVCWLVKRDTGTKKFCIIQTFWSFGFEVQVRIMNQKGIGF
jgi:hypothetical protein